MERKYHANHCDKFLFLIWELFQDENRNYDIGNVHIISEKIISQSVLEEFLLRLYGIRPLK